MELAQRPSDVPLGLLAADEKGNDWPGVTLPLSYLFWKVQCPQSLLDIVKRAFT